MLNVSFAFYTLGYLFFIAQEMSFIADYIVQGKKEEVKK